MKIAFIIGEFPELSITFIIDQIAALLDRGHDVDIYPGACGTTDKVHQAVNHYHMLDRTIYPPVESSNLLIRMMKASRPLWAKPWSNPAGHLRTIQFFSRKPAVALSLLHRIKAFFPERHYDLLHCHFAPSALRALIARDLGLLHGKLLTTFHGYGICTYPRNHGRDIYRELFQSDSIYTSNSNFTASRAIELGCPADRIIKLPVGVHTNQFTFRERHIERNEEVRILTVARLVECKGIKYGIRAVTETLKRHPQIRYQIAGDGPLMAELKSLALELRVEKQVDFLGGQTVTEIKQLYDKAHLFFLPGVEARNGSVEAQGVVLIEAQASGLPVLATCVGGIPESVSDGESGILVPPRDVHGLAEKLRDLLDHPQRWPEMGRAGRRFAEQHFDINRLNDELLTVYEHVMKGTIPDNLRSDL